MGQEHPSTVMTRFMVEMVCLGGTPGVTGAECPRMAACSERHKWRSRKEV